MKKLLLLLCASAFALNVYAQEIPFTNLILPPNSDFETGTAPGWSSWGNSSTKEVVENGYDGSKYCLQLVNPTDASQYSAQLAYDFSTPFEVGTTYVVKFYAKSSVANGDLQFQIQRSSDNGQQGAYNTFTVGTDWQLYTYSFEMPADKEGADRIVLNFGKVAATYDIDDIEFGPQIPLSEVNITNLILPPNSDFETGTAPGWSSWGNSSTKEVVENGYDGSKYCLQLVNPTDASQYSAQLAYDFSTPFEVGTTYVVKFYAKSSVANGDLQFQIQRSSDNGQQGAYNTFTVGTDWQLYTYSFEMPADKEGADRIVLNFGKVAATYDIDDIEFGPVSDNNSPSQPQIPTNPEVTIPNDLTLLASGDQADGTIIVKWSDAIQNTVVDGVECIEVTNETASDETSSLQLAIDLNYQPGEDYYIQFDVMGDPSYTAITAWYQYKETYTAFGYNDFNSFYVRSDEDWETVTLYGSYSEPTEGNLVGKTANRVVINLGAYEGTLYMTNFKVYGPEEPVTPGEITATVTPNSTEDWFDSFSVVWAEKVNEPLTLKIVDESLISVTKGKGELLEFTANLTEYQETEESENYEDTQLVVTLDEMQMAVGEVYSLTIKPGAIQYQLDNEWIDNELVEYSFTLEAGAETGTIDDPVISPANGSKLTALESVTLTWEDWGVVAIDNYEGDPISMTITADSGNQSVDLDFEIIGTNPNGEEVGGNAVKVVLPQTYSEDGVYTIVIPEGMFFISNLDGVNGENEEITLTYTVTSTPSAVESLYDLNGNSEVYKLNGVKVGNVDNINNLNKGIYIVNGKKIVVR